MQMGSVLILNLHFSELDCVKENYDFRGADIRMVRNLFQVTALTNCY